MYKNNQTHNRNFKRDSSWQKVSKWYDKKVSTEGHYFHQEVIFPKLMPIINSLNPKSILDLGCGQGVLARQINNKINYTGVDLSSDLINSAKRQDQNKLHEYIVADATENMFEGAVGQPRLRTNEKFDLVTCILAMQNMENYHGLIKNASENLHKDGNFVIVLNHPYFRIPRLTSWGIDEQSKQQYRKIMKYKTAQKVPINMNPGSEKKIVTWSFHNPFEDYVNSLGQNGFGITKIEEWISNKSSVGKAAKMENRAREEFPMFMVIVAKKL